MLRTGSLSTVKKMVGKPRGGRQCKSEGPPLIKALSLVATYFTSAGSGALGAGLGQRVLTSSLDRRGRVDLSLWKE